MLTWREHCSYSKRPMVKKIKPSRQRGTVTGRSVSLLRLRAEGLPLGPCGCQMEMESCRVLKEEELGM